MSLHTSVLLPLFLAAPLLTSSPITIARSTTYQTIEGFGALGAMDPSRRRRV